MTVNRGQIKAMSDIMEKLNRIENGEEVAPSRAIRESAPSSIASPTVSSGSGVSAASLAEMSNIMMRFRAATEGVREEAQTNDVLLEALQTERTPEGVRIAEWEIKVSESANHPGKFYDVSRDDVTIASDLRLYEAAHLLCVELNKGASITSKKIRKLLALEEQYASAFEDAIRYSNSVKTTTGIKRDIAKTKLSEAKAKALGAKEQLKEIY